jgi:cell wall-associated NlpC family hydrolase
MKTKAILITLTLLCVIPPYSNINSYAAGADEMRNRIIKTAEKYLGARYNYGGMTTKGFDCSGFVQYVFRENGITLPRSTVDQFERGKKIELSEAKPGDLVFFNIYGKRISHVGIFVSKAVFIHAPTWGKRVSFADMNLDYWKRSFVGAVTYLDAK